ncbi:MAG: class I SAM-dependent methyltransferase [Thermodesulfobacteriota bacterium]
MKLKDQLAGTYSISCIQDKKRILVYPAASGSEYLLSFFRKRHPGIMESIVGLGDKDPNKASLRQNGIRVYTPGQLAALDPDAVLVTSPALFEVMRAELRPLFGPDVPILLADHMLEYLACESELSVLASKVAARPFDEALEGPDGGEWYLCMPFGKDRFAKSKKAALTYRMLDQIMLPADLSGKSVLDLAASDAFYSFECEARGAASVLAVEGPGWESVEGHRRFLFARDYYGSRVEHLISRVEDFVSTTDRTFDLVLSLGIYYHLRDPLDYFRKLRRLTNPGGTAIVTGRTIAMAAFDPINVAYDQIHEGKCLSSGRSASFMMLSDRQVGKWTANVPCLLDMMRIAGFADAEVLFDFCPAGSYVSSTAIAAHR